MNEITTKIIETKLGLMRLRANIEGLTEVEFLDKAESAKEPSPSNIHEKREEAHAGSGLKAASASCKNGAHGEEEPDDMLAGYTDNLKINAILNQAETQLREYFEGRRKVFDLPLAPSGTDFQLRVWAELRKIPYGETRTYGDIASALGKPKASRAVGGANNKNPLSILIPCHRVIGRDGSLIGYASGLDIKEKLLKMEAEGL